MTKQEALSSMLEHVRHGRGVLVSNDEFYPGFPTIHQVGNRQGQPLRTRDPVNHLGFGFFAANEPEISFDAGGAMHNAYDGDQWVFGWTVLRGSPEALIELGYDIEEVQKMLEDLVKGDTS